VHGVPQSSFGGDDGYVVIGVWWWLPMRGGPRDIGGRCLLWPIKDHRGLMPGTRDYVKRARHRP
jgi:hypothetical protein